MPTLRCKVLYIYNNTAVEGLPVIVTKAGQAEPAILVSGQDGQTGIITVTKGSTYNIQVQGGLCYQDKSDTVSIPSNATQLINKTIILTKKSHPKGYVYDIQGNPIAQAEVSIPSKNKQGQTASDGSYYFDNLNAGNHTVQVSKSSFKTATTTARVNSCGLFSADSCVLQSSVTKLNVTVKDKFGDPLSSTPVQIKQANTLLGTLTTNSQGKTVFTTNFDDNNEHNLTVVTSPSANIFGAQQSVSVPAGDTMEVEIFCDSDTTGPAVTIVSLTQSGQNLNFNINLSEQGKTSIEYIKPDGQSQSSGWSSQFATSRQGILGIFDAPGEYKVKIKAMDLWGNISETDYQTLSYQVAFNASIGSITQNSAVLTWTPYPDNSGFKNYAIKMQNKPVAEISNRNTSTYTLTSGITPNKNYTVNLQVKSDGGDGSLAEKTLQFQSLSLPPQITSFTISPQVKGTNQSISISAQITDPDTNIGSIELALGEQGGNVKLIIQKIVDPKVKEYSISKGEGYDVPGDYEIILSVWGEQGQKVVESKGYTIVNNYAPEIRKLTFPSKVYAGDENTYEFKLATASLLANATYHIDWGDGSVEQNAIDLEAAEQNSNKFTVCHTYSEAGQYNISAYITTQVGSATLTSKTYNAQCNVEQPVVEPVTEPEEINQQKPKTQKDIKDTGLKKELEKMGEEPIRREEPQAQAIVVKLAFLELPESIVVGQKTKIQVQAENTSSEYVKKCKICLEAEDGFKEEKALTLAANTDKKYVLYWTPEKSGKQKLSAYLQSEPQANISAERVTESVDVKEPEPVDVELTEINLPQEIVVGKRTAIGVIAKNNSATNVRNCSLILQIGKEHKDEKKVSITAQKEKKTTFYWTPDKAGAQKITATLQCEEDKNTKNNSISKNVQVKQESKK